MATIESKVEGPVDEKKEGWAARNKDTLTVYSTLGGFFLALLIAILAAFNYVGELRYQSLHNQLQLIDSNRKEQLDEIKADIKVIQEDIKKLIDKTGGQETE